MNKPIESLVIVGGGTSGWMAASYFAKKFQGSNLRITVVESTDVGTVGVGEATVPSIKLFLSELGIDEKAFINATHATFKLGIDFEGWGGEGEKFFHPFASFGERIASVDFAHYWAYARHSGKQSHIDEFCFSAQMARAGKFSLPRESGGNADLFNFNYAYHFDAVLFAKFLKSYAESKGVVMIDSIVNSIAVNKDNGFVESIALDNGAIIRGDFFIDCTGFSGLLIEKTLHTGYDDWSQWLLSDRALACQTNKVESALPYTRSIAMNSGWRWQIPLQNRVGNGYVYSSEFISNETARAELLGSLSGKLITEPKLLSFTTGIRKKTLNKNVFAVGLSGGFLEPLESTSIYMIQYCLTALYEYFPSAEPNIKLEEKVNKLIRQHSEHLRDFIVLHYCLNAKNGLPFWDHCREMKIPESLQARLDEYLHTGSIKLGEMDFFKMNSWLAVLAGLNRVSHRYHPKVNTFGKSDISNELTNIKSAIKHAVSDICDHESFIKKNCN